MANSLSFKDNSNKLCMLDTYDNLGWKYVSSYKPVVYTPHAKSGEMKKHKFTFTITGNKHKEPFDYPKFDRVDNAKTIIIYAGELSNIIGVDIDDYSDISVEEKLLKFGYTEEFVKSKYPFITRTGKNGLHIEHEYNADLDATCKGLEYKIKGKLIDKKQSKIDIRGTGGLLIGAGSESNIGNYEWVYRTPTKDDKLAPLLETNVVIYNGIVNHKQGGLAIEKTYKLDNNKKSKFNKKYKEIEKIQNDYCKKRNKNSYKISDKSTYDIKLYSKVLEKLSPYLAHEYTDWCVVGMILGNEYDFSETGLDLFKEFSSKYEFYDENEANKLWSYWLKYQTPIKYPALNNTTLLYYLVENCGSNAYCEIQKEIKEEEKLEKKDTETESSLDDLDIFCNEIYKATKKKFEEENFKVDCLYIEEHELYEGDTIYREYRTADFRDRYMDYANIFIKKSCVRFIDMWLKDSEKRRYYDLIFKPEVLDKFITKPNGKTYVNCFRGYNGSMKTLEELDLSKDYIDNVIRVWRYKLLLLCEGNEVYAEWVFHFIRKMILYPEQKSMNVMICFVSNFTGLGKSTFVRFLMDIIGSDYSVETPDLNKIFSGFSEMRYKKILLHYEEGESKCAVPLYNRFKSLITDEKDIVEPKFQKARQVDNYNHLFVTSNTSCMKIEDTDRRTALFKGKTPTDKEAFLKHQDEWEKVIENPSKNPSKYIIYDYITKYKCGCEMCDRYYNYGYNIPVTEARIAIQEKYIPVEMLYLRYLLESNFKDYTYGMSPPSDNLKKIYSYTENHIGFSNDNKVESDYEFKPIEFKNPKDRLEAIYENLKHIVNTRNFIETNKPLTEYNNLTKLKKEDTTSKNIKMCNVYTDILGLDYDVLTSNYDWDRNKDKKEVFVRVKRNTEDKYVKLDISYFVYMLNKWRSKNNHPSSSKTATSIRDNLKEVFNYDTDEKVLDVKKNDGKYKIIFRKDKLYKALINKYKFVNIEEELL